ncbi:RagB/SusD family nutrient uptake outer membrane protein [Aquimarina agarivorans]|uniref:RagB/SusD family nutrient uptake outer membrane protein n=1 Tax=Aquimarina agarivorans TaxID=980584 RepID=UPI000248F27D|nr:RagB/SusD family nutrient uptake outer membrane protein [Aquimarina agarivorans]
MKYINITLGLIILSINFSCEEFLSETPDNRLELNSIEKVAALSARAYSQASVAFTDEMTDLAGPMGNRNGAGKIIDLGGNTIELENRQAYKWEVITANDQNDTPNDYWNENYEAIAHSNQALQSLKTISGDPDPDHINAIKGEALLSRAYHHFMLVNLFGKHYDAATAATDLGIPYITEPEESFLPTYTRNTVQEVYDLVEKDLLEGLNLINTRFFEGTTKFHFSKLSALAFASRFYLWKGDYQKCIEFSDRFYDGKSPLEFITNYDNVRGAGYNQTADNYNSPDDSSNLLFTQVFSTHQRRDTGFRLNDRELTDLLASPVGTHVGNTTGIWQVGTQARYLSRLREFFFRESLSATTGNPYFIEQLFKGEEVILNRAEAKLMLNQFDDALDDLNILVAAHYDGNVYTEDIINNSTFDTARTLNEKLLNIILEERKVQFLDHGLRWFDIKRYKIEITHELPLTEGGEILTLEAEDLRKVLQIPQDAIDSGLAPNPR